MKIGETVPAHKLKAKMSDHDLIMIEDDKRVLHMVYGNGRICRDGIIEGVDANPNRMWTKKASCKYSDYEEMVQLLKLKRCEECGKAVANLDD
jgi:hypothetical protein